MIVSRRASRKGADGTEDALPVDDLEVPKSVFKTSSIGI